MTNTLDVTSALNHFQLTNMKQYIGYAESLFTFNRIPLLTIRLSEVGLFSPEQEYVLVIRDYDSGQIMYQGNSAYRSDIFNSFPNNIPDLDIKKICYECVILILERLKNCE